MRDRGYYKSQTKFDRGLRAKPCDGKQVPQDPQLIIDVLDSTRLMDKRFREWALEDGIHWFLGFDSYVKDKNGTLSPKFRDTHSFRRGEIVLVDFFGHYGTELTYEHPAIVLADTYDGVIVAPISSRCYNDGIDTHVSLERNVGDLGKVKNNCGIKLEQSRFISKRRILEKFKRVTNTDKLNEIDNVLMQILTPVSYAALTQESQELSEELKTKELIMQEQEKEIDTLNRKIQLLEQQLLEMQQEANAS
jgi:mRNA-degrading endonuclease toxin of MazEF toxin-antitoxin module